MAIGPNTSVLFHFGASGFGVARITGWIGPRSAPTGTNCPSKDVFPIREAVASGWGRAKTQPGRLGALTERLESPTTRFRPMNLPTRKSEDP